MRFFDRKCTREACDFTIIDSYEPTDAPVIKCAKCGWITERAWLTTFPSVHGDEIDITVKHGLCDEKTGEPVRYRSKSEMARVAKERGLMSYVTHQGTKSGDRSKHTSRWI